LDCASSGIDAQSKQVMRSVYHVCGRNSDL
jgi:hypothetical protein